MLIRLVSVEEKSYSDFERYFLYSLPMLLRIWLRRPLKPRRLAYPLTNTSANSPLVHMTNFHSGDPTKPMVAPNHEEETIVHVKNLSGERNPSLHSLTRPVYKKRVVESKKSDPIEVLPIARGFLKGRNQLGNHKGGKCVG